MRLPGPLRSVIAHLRGLVTQPLHELTLAQRNVRYWIDLARHCARKLHRDKASQMAAALTYHTLFSLLPMVVLVLVFLHSFRGLESYAETFKTTVIEHLLPESLVPSARGPAGDGETADVRTAEFDDVRAVMAGRIEEGLEYLEGVSFGGIGIVGFLVFVYGATKLMSVVERSFNEIFRVSHARPLTVRLPVYFTVLLLGPFVFVAGQVLQERLLALLAAGRLTKGLAGPLIVLSPLLGTWLALFVGFTLLPNTRVQRRGAAIGSFTAAASWLVGKELFERYAFEPAASSLYGALALLPLFLLWVYATWLVILFGLELTCTLQDLADGRPAELDASPSRRGDPRWLVPVLVEIGRAFADGGTASAGKVAAGSGLPHAIVNGLCEVLEEIGFVRRVEGADGPAATYVLARPPDRLSVADVIEAGRRAMIEPTNDGTAWHYLGELQQAELARARDTTIADLVGRGDADGEPGTGDDTPVDK